MSTQPIGYKLSIEWQKPGVHLTYLGAFSGSRRNGETRQVSLKRYATVTSIVLELKFQLFHLRCEKFTRHTIVPKIQRPFLGLL